MQRGPIWAVDGDIISMVGGRDYVFVVHREGSTSLDGNQNLKYTLRTVDSFRVMHTGRLPVNKGCTLKWIGITDEGVSYAVIAFSIILTELIQGTCYLRLRRACSDA